MNCAQCGTQLPEDARFCTDCGASTGISSSRSNDRGRLEPFKSGKSKQFQVAPDSFPKVLEDLERWLQNEEYKVTRQSIDSTAVVLNVKSKGAWKQLFGLSVELSVMLECKESRLHISIGNEGWIGKIIVFCISWFALWPLTITSITGMVIQNSFPNKLFRFIEAIAE